MSQGTTISGQYRDPYTASGTVWHYTVVTEGGPPYSKITLVEIDERGRNDPQTQTLALPYELLKSVVEETEADLSAVAGL